MSFSFILHPIPPFRLDYTVWALRRRDKNIIDRWDGKYYSRLLIIDNEPIKVMVEQQNINDPKIRVLTSQKINSAIKAKISKLLKIMLGLNWNLHNFYQFSTQNSSLEPLISQFVGLKPPRFPSIFEALVNAISCQQISLDAGLQIQNRLIQYAGIKIKDNNEFIYAFPRPNDVANCSVVELKKIGYSAHKCETLIQLASAIIENKFQFGCLEKKPNAIVIDFLCRFKGIGRWSAEYVLLRGLGKIDTFPGDDVGAQNNLQRLLSLKDKLDYQKILDITAKWYPYAGLIYFHLLLQRLNEKGVI